MCTVETLTTRIIKSSEAVPIVHLENTIQHSENQPEQCQNKMPLKTLKKNVEIKNIQKWPNLT